ncbi:uncharacterized protein LOC133802669 isoform X2 [Humulus lupulus]|uniref:uncharacterized protein LOC133802669 isoform X2 n=1 Tax=Humulus lupulus TaxID=3486 RepID=UPI002B40A958|nr:uncharacterized protein LOC133802669 isoform X2 [Humulus lupulus]
MKDSTSKGVNWFEGIIPDVNDNMFQGTFRYVENHVNNVGGTLKKLCSDVVQDFLPLSADPVKCEAKELVPEGGASSTLTKNNSAISIENFFSDLVVGKSPVVIDAIDHDVDLSTNEKSTDAHEASESALATWKINELTTEDSGLSVDLNTIEESVVGSVELTSHDVEYIEESTLDEFIGNNHDNSDQFKNVETSGSGLVPALTKRNSDFIIDENAIKESTDDSELTFPSVTESIEASLIDKSIETNNEKDCVVSTADAVALVEKQQLNHGYVSAEHHNADHLSMHTDETSDSVLASVEFNSLTHENSDLNNDVNSIKESADGGLELTSSDVNESSKASSVDGPTEANHEDECMFSVNVALPTSIQNLENEQCSGVLCDIIADDAECYFSTSSIPSEIVTSFVSEDTVTGTGHVSSTSSSLRNSTSLPGYSSDILFAGANFCCVSETSSGFLSSTPASVVSINEEALRKQLISSCTLLPLDTTGLFLNSHVQIMAPMLMFLTLAWKLLTYAMR